MRNRQQHNALDRFLATIERRAFGMAKVATGNTDDALELVQEAMLKLVRHYADRPEQEWGPLFHRILQSAIRDWFRRQKVRHHLFGWLGSNNRDDDNDALEQNPGHGRYEPHHQLGSARFTQQLEQALQGLPYRQQQAFLLRVWEGLDVNQTAAAMGCSSGSVKTHYARALAKLREQLQDHTGHWNEESLI